MERFVTDERTGLKYGKRQTSLHLAYHTISMR